jgi:hypothetical protein
MRSEPFGICLRLPLLGYCLLFSGGPLMAQSVTSGPEVIRAVHQDVSPALRDIPPAIPSGLLHEHPVKPMHPEKPFSGVPDGAVQTARIAQLATITSGLNFDGVGNGFVGPNGAFSVNSAPPDTNAAVGATQVVQWVNESFAVFDKTTGKAVLGPVAGNTLWSGFGGTCETSNSGDIIAQYDKAANRWFLTQPVFTSPFMICIAVSTASDATGTFHRYAFPMDNFPDYPKYGVWSDGYYGSFNMFSGNTFVGAKACSFDRTAMLAGAAATSVCFQLSSSFGGLLPSDLDGATAPPAGSPDFFLNFGTNVLNLWKFHADFATPANSTFTGPTVLAVAAFSEACGGGTCVPQAGTRQQLDSLGDRLMYRLAYRNFTTAPAHESLVVNHSVRVSGGGKHSSEVDGLRWYEIRSPNGTAAVFQQGTFSPDSNTRWMGSIAMDKVGDIAVGYSVSSGQINPAIRFAVRTPTDAAGTLEPETSIIAGTGSQLRNLNRWGDYSSMTIDPVDDCTFWYTTEYLKSSGTFNWSTRLASFRISGCQ